MNFAFIMRKLAFKMMNGPVSKKVCDEREKDFVSKVKILFVQE